MKSPGSIHYHHLEEAIRIRLIVAPGWDRLNLIRDFKSKGITADEYQWCCKSISTSATNLFMEVGQIASWEGQNVLSNWGDVGGCKATSRKWANQDGLIIWDEKAFKNVCPVVPKGKYVSTLHDMHAIIDEIQAAFEIKVNAKLNYLEYGIKLAEEEVFRAT
uniref:Uncharacterized protein n=1 Tax=Romanomermis culicivorax TaxID=13658 RepID=A0A915I6J7_ROMCU